MSEMKVLAVVGNREITDYDVDAYISVLPAEQQRYAQNPQFRAQVLEQLTAMQLMALKAEEEKLQEKEEFKRTLAFYRGQLLAQMVQDEVLGAVKVTDEEIRDFFEKNQAKFSKGETVRARHILVDSEDRCNEILEEIKSGAKTFEAAASDYSTCPSGKQGGDLGEFGHGQMVKEFDEAAFASEVDELVGPVKTQFGYHLIQVYAKSDSQAPVFEEMKNRVEQMALQQKQADAFNNMLAELKAKYMK